MHYSFLENLENSQLDRYKFDHVWDMDGERQRINLIVLSGDDIVRYLLNDWPNDKVDEDMLVLNLPKRLGRCEFLQFCRFWFTGRANTRIAIVVEGNALAAHFSFQHQRDVAKTDLLARYHSYALEKGCLRQGYSS